VLGVPSEPQRDLWFNPHLSPRGNRAVQVGVPLLAVKTYKRKRQGGYNIDTLYSVLIPAHKSHSSILRPARMPIARPNSRRPLLTASFSLRLADGVTREPVLA
jgi:hypothetical protein